MTKARRWLASRLFLCAFLPAWALLSGVAACKFAAREYERRTGRPPVGDEWLKCAVDFPRGFVMVQPCIIWIAICLGGLWVVLPGAFSALRDQPSVCPGCEYNLRGNVSGRCPECGMEFDPAQPPTALAAEPARLRRAQLAFATYIALLILLSLLIPR